MKLAGTSDTGWVAVDLTDVAKAIATLRGPLFVVRQHARQARQEPQERSAAPARR